jgi:hypothetical protein
MTRSTAASAAPHAARAAAHVPPLSRVSESKNPGGTAPPPPTLSAADPAVCVRERERKARTKSAHKPTRKEQKKHAKSGERGKGRLFREKEARSGIKYRYQGRGVSFGPATVTCARGQRRSRRALGGVR